MQIYEEHLSQESIDALSVLLGSNIQAVLSHDCDADFGSAVLTVQSISIPIGRERFVIIENDWTDTPESAIDYYFLSVRIAESPDLIDYVPFPGPGGSNYKADHLRLRLGAESKVTKIEVLSASEADSEESVNYDAGLIITRNDGLKVAFIRQESIAGLIHIVHTETDIEKLTTNLEVRLSLVAEQS